MQAKEQDRFFEEFEQCLELKKYDQAEKLIKQLKQEHPRNNKYIRSYIKLLKIVDYDRAIEFCESLIDNDRTGEFHATLLSLYIECKRYDDAIEVINDTVNKDYDSYTSYFNFCFAQITFLKDRSTASTCLRAAKQSLKLKETFYANKLVAMIYAELNDFDNTKEYYLRTIDLVSDEKIPSIFLDFSKACLGLHKYDEARFYSCCRLLNTKKNNLRSLYVIWKNNDFNKLKELLEKMPDKENRDFYNMLLAVSALNENKRTDFVKSINSVKNDDIKKDTLAFLTTIYNKEDRFSVSDIIFKSHELENSDDLDVCYNKVKALYIKRRYDEALVFANSILDREKSNKVLLLKGKILCELAMCDEAEDIFMYLIDKNDSEAAKIEIASLYTSFGDIINARKALYDMKQQDFALTKNTEICIYENRLEEAEKMIKNINDEPTKSYYQEMLINYDRNAVKSHISNHFKDDNNKMVHNIFNNNINVNYIYNKCIGMINNRTYHISTGYSDQYIFDLGEYIGAVNEIPTSYVMVITYPNSNKIITIYPTFGKSLFKGIDSKENNNKLRVRK